LNDGKDGGKWTSLGLKNRRSSVKEFGIDGLPLPKEFGGSDADPLTTVGVLESLGHGCKDNGLVFSINAHMWTVEIPLPRLRHRGAEMEVPAASVQRRSDRRQRHERTGLGIGRL
jgi:hypothetical protein